MYLFSYGNYLGARKYLMCHIFPTLRPKYLWDNSSMDALLITRYVTLYVTIQCLP